MRGFIDKCSRKIKITQMNDFNQVRSNDYWEGSRLPEKNSK